MKRKYVSVVATLVLVLVSGAWGSCNKESLQKANLKFVTSVQAARKVTTVQHDFGHISDEGYVARLRAFKNVNATSDKLAETFELYKVITPENKQVFIDNVQISLNALNDLLIEGKLGIKNHEKQAEFTAWIGTAYGTLSSFKVFLEALKKPVDTEGVRIQKVKVDTL